MAASRDLNLARKNLTNSLGDNAKVYFEKMKLWFQMKSSKEEFDCEARNIMTDEQIHLHNEFLLCLFNKVRGLATATPLRPMKANNTHVHTDKDKILKEKRLKLKRKYKTDRSNFEPADMYVDVLSQMSSPVGDEPIGANRSSAQELLLPDRTFVLARLMLAAWENNMDSADENTAHIIIAATQIFLKNIITAVLTKRKGFAVHQKSFIYNIGEPVPSSWKRNTMFIPRGIHFSKTTDIIEPDGQVPAVKQTVDEMEQATAFAMACSTPVLSPALPPVSVNDLLQTLKIYKNLVNNHTVYATNMERLFTYPTHPTWEDLEIKKFMC
ncbi:transcriptional adapter 1-like [Microplitis mediator]|uniref:transcriptional adapter 1-like n=1 Tax=Microplitis mediator TaxID=375433 RepID=UPI00255429C0|nr:transcriptional adapter 1-like [Microplitis mediator]